jgi:hypothetical protein
MGPRLSTLSDELARPNSWWMGPRLDRVPGEVGRTDGCLSVSVSRVSPAMTLLLWINATASRPVRVKAIMMAMRISPSVNPSVLMWLVWSHRPRSWAYQ